MPNLGRFTSTDVLWEKYAGWSPYHYCGNNPVNRVDWNGKKFNVKGTKTEKEFTKMVFKDISETISGKKLINDLKNIEQVVTFEYDNSLKDNLVGDIETHYITKIHYKTKKLSVDKNGNISPVKYNGSTITIAPEKIIERNGSIIQTVLEELIHATQAKEDPKKWYNQNIKDLRNNVEYEDRKIEIVAKKKVEELYEKLPDGSKY